MNIGIISDTHNAIKPVEKAFKYFKNKGIRLVVHCGDWIKVGSIKTIGKLAKKYNLNLKGVPGNNDLELQQLIENQPDEIERNTGIGFPKQDMLEIIDNGERIAVYHGHDRKLLKAIIDSGNYNAVLTGHTHRASVTNKNKTLIVNPGSIRYKSSIINGQKHNTFAIFDTDKNEAEVKIIN